MRVGPDHKLEGVPYEHSPNQTPGFELKPEIVVIHYTATVNGRATLEAMKSPALRASAHFLIDRNGETWQLVPCNRKAWHAGASRYNGQAGCNNFALGIELLNPGPVFRDGNGIWRSAYNKPFDGDPDTPEMDEPRVIQARHESGVAPKSWTHWAAYDEPQLRALDELARVLIEHYGLGDVVGHDDIAPTRKFDPGPAFDMDQFRRRVLTESRASDDDDLYEVTSETLNVRVAPPDDRGRLSTVSGPPLLRGAKVDFVEASGRWWHVTTPGGCTEGWVHSKYLRPVL